MECWFNARTLWAKGRGRCGEKVGLIWDENMEQFWVSVRAVLEPFALEKFEGLGRGLGSRR